MLAMGLLLIGFTGTLMPNVIASENLFYGNSIFERVPQAIVPNSPQTIEIKFQYADGPYSLSNFKPIIDVSPKEALPYVHVKFEPIEGINRNSIVRLLGTITVDSEIPSEKIFLNVSFVGTSGFDEPISFKSGWFESAIIDIRENLSGGTLDVTEYPIFNELGELLCTGIRGAEVDEHCKIIRTSPRTQQLDGVKPEHVKCNFDLYRSYKTSDGTAFCASGYALKELIHRGYAQAFDSVNSATIQDSGSIVREYCPASQKLLQWGWYGYVKNPEIVNTNIDLVYDSEEDSHGVEFTFESKTDIKSMIWVFVECDNFDKTWSGPENRHPAFLGFDIPEICTEDMIKHLVKYSSMFDRNVHYAIEDIGLENNINVYDFDRCVEELLERNPKELENED
ncbi:hypothetical protein DSQ20_04585 [Nitrosarchaeum sp. AC2]|nr:hypothetical protein DSQ20_04585 [Nitrosarchaeum sp. AC2]